MRVFLIVANLAAMLGLLAMLREEWPRITDYGMAWLVFGGGFALTSLNVAYIRATPAAGSSRWASKARDAWTVLRS